MFNVYHNYQGSCEIVAKHAARDDAITDCAARNDAEREANSGASYGHYWTTDAELPKPLTRFEQALAECE